ncbi:cyclin-dependent kinase inhibitor 1C-like [Drosophila subobscura]|uniref:cyclin-dependent kinase inhibitor 1C-like n=1 Tax=Drosophila subobscura TaxID=7241 RepID=UPI00155AAEC7|nr:cyclin-dependent kinase inhibitor 1C-like [Drosophila subobscura]
MKLLAAVVLAILAVAHADVSHLSGYNYAPVSIPAPAPAPIKIAPAPAPAPAPVQVSVPAPVNQYIPPAPVKAAPAPILAPAPVLAPQPVLEEIEPVSADGYRYKTIRRRVIRRRY